MYCQTLIILHDWIKKRISFLVLIFFKYVFHIILHWGKFFSINVRLLYPRFQWKLKNQAKGEGLIIFMTPERWEIFVFTQEGKDEVFLLILVHNYFSLNLHNFNNQNMDILVLLILLYFYLFNFNRGLSIVYKHTCKQNCCIQFF